MKKIYLIKQFKVYLHNIVYNNMSQAQEQTESINNIFNSFNTINDSITLFKMQLNSMQQQLKNVEKNVKKELKAVKKVVAEKSKPKNKRAPSGFAKPTKVTKELCDFMNRPEGSEIARTDVTRALISYIDLNNLQNETNKKIIYPDEKLKSLLGINDDEELTYFTIQKYMNKHFISLKDKSDNNKILVEM